MIQDEKAQVTYNADYKLSRNKSKENGGTDDFAL